MKILRYWKFCSILSLITIIPTSTTGQSLSKYCEFEPARSYRKSVLDATSTLSGNSSLGMKSVPIALTFIMKSDSTSSYYHGLAQNIMDSISAHFLSSGIHFYLADSPVFIYEDLVYDFTNGENLSLIYPGIKNNRLNVVLANSVSLAKGAEGVCGVAGTFPQTVFVDYDCIPSNTISHEIGHEFGLAHTHHTKFGTELANGSNCLTAGDLICDTPADPNRNDLVGNNCVWEGTYKDGNGYKIHLVDANGDKYNPDISNLMSYYGAYGCRNDFTFQQSLVMHKTLATKLLTYGYETPKMAFEIYGRADLCDKGYTVSTRIKNPDSNAKYQWDFDSDGVIDEVGLDVNYIYKEYGDYTIKLTMTYPNKKEFYNSKVCVINYSNEAIIAPFLDSFNENVEKKHVTLIEESWYKWNLNLYLPNKKIVAGDQIHINENSIMEYAIDMSSLEQAFLEFEYDCNADADIGGDSLLIELTTCDESKILFEKWGKNLGTNGEYLTVNLPLPKMKSNMVKLRFTSKGDTQDWHDIYIDNLRVYGEVVSTSLPNSNNEIYLFPNPTKSSIKIQSNLVIETINLYDIYGKSIDINLINNTLDLSHLPGGIYIVKIFSGEKWFSNKIFRLN